MFFKKRYKYVFCIIPLMILLNPLMFIGGKYEINEPVAATFLSNMFGGSYGFKHVEIVLAVESLGAITIINILLSDYISGDIREKGEYIFTRMRNKKRWYLKKSINMFFYCLLGVIIAVMPFAVTSTVKSQQTLKASDCVVFLQTIIILTLFSFFCCEVINIISIKTDASIGVLAMYSIIAISLVIVYIAQTMGNKSVAMKLLKFNLMSNVVVSWNFSQSFVWWGIFYYICINAIILTVGVKIIERTEIGTKL